LPTLRSMSPSALGCVASRPWQERAAVLFRAAALIRARRVELAALEVFEAGKPINEADADVCEAIDSVSTTGARHSGSRRVLRWAKRRGGERVPLRAAWHRVVIAPWNFPSQYPPGWSPPRSYRNAVLLQTAEQTPGVALRLVEILHQAGVHPACSRSFPVWAKRSAPISSEHPVVSFVAFTGSKSWGCRSSNAPRGRAPTSVT